MFSLYYIFKIPNLNGFQILTKYESIETIKSVSADGCPVNTGHKTAAIRTLELGIGRPLQWLICTLHLNELVFKHIFEDLGKCTKSTMYVILVLQSFMLVDQGGLVK